MALFGGTSNSELITGTSGNDVILGQGGVDTLIGGDGDDELRSNEYIVTGSASQFDYLGDRLEGGNGNDTLFGGSGNDTLVGGAGSNALTGGTGYDTAVYAGARADYTVAMSGGMPVNVQSITAGGEHDSLQSVERISFSDTSWAYDIDGNAGDMYRLYQAALNRAPDKQGLGYWIKIADDGNSAASIAANFISSKEFTDLYGANLSNEQFVTKLYENILDRPYDQGGFDFWMASIEEHGATRADVLDHFAQSAENAAGVIAEIQNGIEYTLYG